MARRSVLMKRGAGEAQENVGERVRVRCRCFGNFACFGGIVQRLLLGAVWLVVVAAASAVWLLQGLCGCC